MKKWIIGLGIIILICSGVIGITININVNSFEDARNKVIQWYDEVFIPLVERGFTLE